MATLPINVDIYDADFNYLGSCNAYESLNAQPGHLLIGKATLTVSLYDEITALLGTKGNRLVIKYPGGIMSGPIRGTAGQSQSQSTNGTMAYTIEDDVRVFWALLGYPVPGSPLTAQGAASVTDTITGPAETVVKHYVTEALALIGWTSKVHVAPDQGRGSTITASIRMQMLADVLLPLLTSAGIGLQCYQDGDHLLFDVYATNTYPTVLTEHSGVVQAWTSSSYGPSVTRSVVGGSEVGTANQYVLVTDATAEADWHDILMSYTDDSSETGTAKLTAAGQAALAAGAATAGLTVTLSDTDDFQYGSSVKVGDIVSIQVGPGIAVTDVLSQVNVNYDKQTGLTITPVVGDLSSNTSAKFVKQMVALARTVRKFLAK